LELS
jgi:5-formyltetrahydrofolate cyclo-ligase